MKNAIAITGRGLISSAGSSPEELFESSLHPPVTPSDGEYHAAPFALAERSRRIAAKLDRTCQLALFAANKACEEANIFGIDRSRVGIVAGTSRGPVGSWDEAYARLADGRRMRPTLAAAGSVASLSGAVVADQGFTGPSQTLSATCASAAHAIATGAMWLESGIVDVVLAGGAEGPLGEFLSSQMKAAGLVASPSVGIRPFDKNRGGFLPGEGSGFLVLERRSHAESRGAQTYGFLRGFSLRTASSGKTGVESDGATLTSVIQEALNDAGASPDQIAYVNAHGTGTEANDRVEAKALAAIFGTKTPISSTKPVTGHCLGATPALEAILSLEALANNTAPPNHNCSEPVENLLFTPSEPADLAGNLALSLSSGFWGKHAALIFSKTA